MRFGNRGSSLESLILASNSPFCWVEKIPHGVKNVGGVKMVRTKSLVDFVGSFYTTGRAIFFDAKMCDLVNHFPAGNKTHVTPEQRALLIRQGQRGAVAGLLVESTRRRLLYWLSWRHLDGCGASIRWDDERMYAIGASSVLVNWRAVLEVETGVAK